MVDIIVQIKESQFWMLIIQILNHYAAELLNRLMTLFNSTPKSSFSLDNLGFSSGLVMSCQGFTCLYYYPESIRTGGLLFAKCYICLAPSYEEKM